MCCSKYIKIHIIPYKDTLKTKGSGNLEKNGVLDSSKKRMKLTILSTEGAQDSELCSFF